MKQGYCPDDPQPWQHMAYLEYQQLLASYPAQPYDPTEHKRSSLLLVSTIAGLAYALIMIVFFTDIQRAILSGEWLDVVMRQLSSVVSIELLAPHIVVAATTVAVNAAAWYFKDKWLVLLAAAGYLVAALLFLVYSLFLLPSLILVTTMVLRYFSGAQSEEMAYLSYDK